MWLDAEKVVEVVVEVLVIVFEVLFPTAEPLLDPPLLLVKVVTTVEVVLVTVMV